jgi:hypothetical protein
MRVPGLFGAENECEVPDKWANINVERVSVFFTGQMKVPQWFCAIIFIIC